MTTKSKNGRRKKVNTYSITQELNKMIGTHKLGKPTSPTSSAKNKLKAARINLTDSEVANITTAVAAEKLSLDKRIQEHQQQFNLTEPKKKTKKTKKTKITKPTKSNYWRSKPTMKFEFDSETVRAIIEALARSDQENNSK